MTDITAKLAEALRECAIVFRQYEQMHLAKKTQDGDEKAYRNHQMADMCEKTLTAYTASQGTRDEETVERVRAAIAEGLYYGLPQVDAALVPDDLAASLTRAALSALPADDALRGKLAGVDEKALEVGSQAGLAAYEAERDLHDVFRAAIAAYLAAVRDKG